MRMLAGAKHNVCAVGDEDQSIYSWRGADIRNILEFEKDFPEAKIVRLEQNYRSTQTILQAHQQWLRTTSAAKEKISGLTVRVAARSATTKLQMEKMKLYSWQIAPRVICGRQKTKDARVAVLYRTNSQSRLFEEAMRRYQLKYHVVGGFSFYERAEIKDLISYLKVVQNPDDSISLSTGHQHASPRHRQDDD